MSREPNVAVIGASGAVGDVFLRVAEERNFPVGNLKLLATARSAGKKLRFRGEEITVEETTAEALKGADLVFCSATSAASREWAPVITAGGGIMIDDGSAFRMQANVPLVVPEINGDDLEWHERIVSIPNCTTTPLVMALHAMRQVAALKRVTVATYQAVSGTGVAAIQELRAQLEAYGRGEPMPAPEVYPQQIALNVIPQVDVFGEDGYTAEEAKMRNETRKILHEPELPFSATCVRVPTIIGHAEAVQLEFQSAAALDDLREALRQQPGMVLMDEPSKSVYPTPLNTAGDDRAFVGRLRIDPSVEHGVAFWCVTDNLRKGAATNAIQIAEELIRRGKV
ncbi:MAG: aspartate-semialdehyde dehydrogenase [Dehalococcoidia bacterium]|nr:aspartate-semialdehyde dehydrogenase [Dehalococcoidia bacterium]HRC62075.1 aspartate-semialdehyde dehydrogenase [Dehalococcoidia bacterium]